MEVWDFGVTPLFPDQQLVQEHLWKTQVQTNATLEEMESQQGVYQAHGENHRKMVV